MKHVMLDLETWGTKPGCVIRSIGMVQFDPLIPRFGEKFYCNVDTESQIKIGAHVDEGTKKWWDRQSEEARNALEYDKVVIEEACLGVINYFKKTGALFVWSQGSNFDTVILQCIFDMLDLPVPWRYYNTRDTRTIYHAANYDDRRMPRVGDHHNALDDAMHQVRCVYRCFQILKGESR